MNKTLGFLLALIIITATSVTPCFSKVAGVELNPIYDGPASDEDVIASHGVKFSVGNGIVLYDSGNLTLEAYQDFPDNMQTLMVALYSVSYKASWQDKPVVVYQWSIHDPANLHDDDPNPQQVFRYTIELANVPKGEQHIEVTSTGGGYIWGINAQAQAYYQTFSKTSSSSLYFTIDTSPPITPSPTFSFESGILWETNVTWNLSDTPAQNLWETEIRGKGRTWASPAVVGDVIYAGSTSIVRLDRYGGPTIDWINVYAFNATSGAKIWEYKDNSSDHMTNLAVVDGVIYFGAGDHVNALNASSGKLLWRTACSTFVSSPAVDQDMVFIGSSGSVIALDATKGNIIWNFTTRDVVLSSPTVVDGVVYIGSNDANLYALNATNGEKIWSYTAGAGFYCVAAVANDVVYASSDDGNVYALNAATGVKLWNYDTTPADYEWVKHVWMPWPAKPFSPYVDSGVVFFKAHFLPIDQAYTTPGEMYKIVGNGWTWVCAVSAANGNMIWNTTIATVCIGGAAPVVVDGIVYTNTNIGLIALKASNGAVIWNYNNIDLTSASDPVVVNGVLYIGSGDGQLYAIGVPFGQPTVHVVSPENRVYNAASVDLVFEVNKPALWMGYSLDGQDNVTIAGNTTLADLSDGLHNVTVYAHDTFGNMGTSETITFTVAMPEPFPVVPVATASTAAAVAVGAGLLLYFKKRKW